jgi:hypothetical protein
MATLAHFVITARPSGLASRTPQQCASAPPLNTLLSVVACTISGRAFACLQPQSDGRVRLHDVRTIFSHGAFLVALRAHGARTALLRLRCLCAPCTLPPAGRPNSSVNTRPSGGVSPTGSMEPPMIAVMEPVGSC